MRIAAVVALGLAAATAVLLLPPIPQDPAYHAFADRRAAFGVPNVLNTGSNAAFALVGGAGLLLLWRDAVGSARRAFVDARERWFWVVFFAGVALTSVGSAYYHLAPDNARLVWDRLPMTLAFMGFFAAVVAERVDLGAGLRLLGPFLGVGLVSVLYWHVTEVAGAGDLRPYVLVQFYPMLAIPLLMALFPPRYTRGADVFVVVGVYLVAKAFELLDAPIFGLGRVVSGHTLKHLVAAGAAWWVLRMLARRAPLPHPGRRVGDLPD